MNLKYDLLNKPLELKKTHDFCAARSPKLTVVFIHGVAADSSSFTATIKYLEGTTSLRDARFVAFDLLGSGASYTSDKLNYDYKDQLSALHNSIGKLRLGDTPLVLVGHSMGALIAMRYADTYKKSTKRLILVSPPVYTEQDLTSPAFAQAMDDFRNFLAAKYPGLTKGKAFDNAIDKIVMHKKNYKTLAELKTHAVLIYGDKDEVIASYNIPKVLAENPRYLTAVKTIGKHGLARDKYAKIVVALEEVLYA